MRAKNTHWQKNNLFNTECWENWVNICIRMNSEPYLTLFIKINSKQTNDLDIKPEKKKLLEENIGEELLDIGLGNHFSDVTTKASKQKCFCTTKEIMIKVKAQLTKWEKIFASHISDMSLLSKKHKELIQLNSKKRKTNPTFKMGRGTEKTSVQRRHTEGQQVHERMLNN